MMTQKDVERIDFVKALRLDAHNLKKNLKDWDFRFDYRLTEKEARTIRNLVDFFDKCDEIADVIDLLETYDRQMGED